MPTHELKRDGDRNLVFDGTLLGEASSLRRDAERWFEVAIYKTDAGHYVVSGVGKTRVPGEDDRCWAVVGDTGDDVVQALMRYDDDDVPYLTRTARDALQAASDQDEGIRAAFLRKVA